MTTTRSIISRPQTSNNRKSSGTLSEFCALAEPVLHSADPVQFARFMNERERYKVEVMIKQIEVTNLKIFAYTYIELILARIRAAEMDPHII